MTVFGPSKVEQSKTSFVDRPVSHAPDTVEVLELQSESSIPPPNVPSKGATVLNATKFRLSPSVVPVYQSPANGGCGSPSVSLLEGFNGTWLFGSITASSFHIRTGIALDTIGVPALDRKIRAEMKLLPFGMT